MKKIFESVKCPACESGEWQPKSDGVHSFRHSRKEYQVGGLHYAVCNNCGLRGFLPGQRKANRELIQKYQNTLVGYISPSDVLLVREKYLLTQKQANKIFGGGSQGFSKWERGIASPAGPTARLIKLALKHPDVMRALAEDSGVKLAEPIVPKTVSHVFVVKQKTVENLTSAIGEYSTTRGSSFEVELDEYLWSATKKDQNKTFAYPN